VNQRHIAAFALGCTALAWVMVLTGLARDRTGVVAAFVLTAVGFFVGIVTFFRSFGFRADRPGQETRGMDLAAALIALPLLAVLSRALD
jgi:hypothetical protein